jgi:hypothetical protein
MKPLKSKIYEPNELKTLFEALNSAPAWLSRRYILKHMMGWTDDDLRINATLVDEEASQRKMGNKGSY